nr:hypothetical protein [Tanacetum cinerariifolium]
MSSLFADTHNMVAILEKSDAAEGFEQIIDFLNGSYIYYALIVTPHIYVSCIKQFWNTASVKCSDDVTRLQALIDRKKIVISEDVIREILQLDDVGGVVCLPNEEIFAGLVRWDTRSRQKLNFSKYIFDSLVRNVDRSLKFYMYARFIQIIIQNQIGDLSTHTIRYISPALTQKVFENMRRVGKGFSGVEIPLFEGMLAAREIAEEGIAEEQLQADDVVAAAVQESIVEDVANEAIPSTHTPPILPSPPSHDIPSLSQVQYLPPQQPQSSPQAPPQAAQSLEIIKLKARLKRLERANKVKSSKVRHLKKVGTSKRIEASDDMEDVFNHGRMIDDLDKDERIELEVKDADTAETEGRHVAEQAEKQAEIYHLDLDHPSKVLSIQEDDSEVQEVVEIPSIPTAAPTVVAAYTRRRKGVIIRDPEEELSSKTPAETPKLKDKGKGILTETPKPMKKKDQIELDAEYARKLHEEINKDHEEINKDIDWDATIDHVKQKSKKNPQFDANMRFLLKSREEIEEEDREVLKSINETPAQKAADAEMAGGGGRVLAGKTGWVT